MNYWKLLGVAVIVWGIGFYGGMQWKQGELDRLQDSYAEQVQNALQANRDLEKRLQSESDSITQKYQKEKKDAEKTISDLRRRIADGSMRLSVKTVSTGGVSAGSGTEYREERTDLDPGTADALVGIASRGDDAIRDLNQCIDKYESLRR